MGGKRYLMEAVVDAELIPGKETQEQARGELNLFHAGKEKLSLADTRPSQLLDAQFTLNRPHKTSLRVGLTSHGKWEIIEIV